MEETINMTPIDVTNVDAFAEEIVKILDDRKAQNVQLIPVADKTVIADYFIICSGTSNTQVKGIAGELEYKLSERGVKAIRSEGYETGRWVVMDFASIIVHIFHHEEREFFKLEKLWEK